MSPNDFARALLDQGIELLVRNNRLFVWPAKAYAHLSDAEREFLKAHRSELKALAVSKALPEATVVWSPHTAAPTPPMSSAQQVTESTTRVSERRSEHFPGITI